MRRRFVLFFLLALMAIVGLNLLSTGTAQAQTRAGCVDQPTITSLKMCVEEASNQGIIDKQSVTHRLLGKLNAAQEALEDGHTTQAIHKLKSFIQVVQDQTGKHIDRTHAQHMMA